MKGKRSDTWQKLLLSLYLADSHFSNGSLIMHLPINGIKQTFLIHHLGSNLFILLHFTHSQVGNMYLHN